MLERAKVRREKLDTQLSNAGHDIIKRRSPLKDANALLSQAAGNTIVSFLQTKIFVYEKYYRVDFYAK